MREKPSFLDQIKAAQAKKKAALTPDAKELESGNAKLPNRPVVIEDQLCFGQWDQNLNELNKMRVFHLISR